MPISIPTAHAAAQQRHIRLHGCSNFRDLGGYTGHQGRALRWGQVYRSDHLADLTEGDLAQLNALGVARAIDFRGAQERQQHGYAWPQLQQQHSLPIEPTLVQEALQLLQAGSSLSAPDTVALMQDTYRALVLEAAPTFARWFALLLEDERPLVFHCTAGKDRTGWAAALLLHALDVAPEAIAQDYLLSNQLYRYPAALAAQAAQQHIPQEVLQVLWTVQPAFLDSAYAAVAQNWSSMAHYLHEAIGLTPAALAKLRGRYLQSAA